MDLHEQYDRIYRYLYFRLHDRHTAEDLTQETFLRFLATCAISITGTGQLRSVWTKQGTIRRRKGQPDGCQKGRLDEWSILNRQMVSNYRCCSG